MTFRREPQKKASDIKPWRQFSPPRIYAQNHHERSQIRAKGCHRIRTQARASAQAFPRSWRSFGQSQGGGHKRRTFDRTRLSTPLALFRSVLLTGDCDSPIALGSKVGFPSPLYPVFLVAIFLERSSTFSTSLQRSGLGRRFGGLGVPGVSRSMGPTQSEFLSVFAGAHFTEVQPVLSGLRK